MANSDIPKCVSCGSPTNIDVFGELIREEYKGWGEDLCRLCRVNHQRDAWTKAPDWKDLLLLNIAYLRREIDCSPKFGVDLSPETYPLVPSLIRLHEYGFITVDSQPFRDSTYGTSDVEDGGCDQVKQRPYLWCAFPTKHPNIPADKITLLIDKLLSNEKLFTTIYSDHEKYPNTDPSARRVPPLSQSTTNQLHDFRSTATPARECVTVIRSARISEDLNTIEWKRHTFFRVTNVAKVPVADDLVSRDSFGEPFEAYKGMRPLVIGIVTREWEADINIQDVLRGICDDVGLTRVFEEIGECKVVRAPHGH